MNIHNDNEGTCRNQPYDCSRIEKKWQQYWETHKTFEVKEDDSIPKEKRRYVLDMFPYPSAAGLHVGHPAGYTATDIYCRFLRMKGYHVLHPMGFDSFGLPAENYAIKTKTHPRVSTEKNIERFTQQIKRFGFSYDWSRTVSTHTPEYYKWTQWIFLQLYKKGLAYQTKIPVWFCPEMGTVLANEEVINTPEGPRSERGNHPVERRPLRQWLLKITAYADRLLQDLDTLEWPESVKAMQRNWIGRSEGAEIQFPIKDRTERISVFTTRPDTLWGATYMVLSPEHPLVKSITTSTQMSDVTQYVQTTSLKSDLERTELAKEKTGVFTGAYAINPVNNTPIPIWISDYVLMSYGTGAIMAVPAHDTRDFEFAKKFNLDIVEVIAPSQNHDSQQPLSEAYTEEGVLINSDMFDGYDSRTAKKAISTWLENNNLGSLKVNYKLHDWIFSRQRYWGEPIPVIHMEDGSVQTLDENELPLTLPEVESYTPTGTGESPLANIDTWCNITTTDNKNARRETNTMPQWAGSCWYYLRYTDPHNHHQFASKEKLAYWLPVDLYVGGAEHAVLHLLYARFWHKVLYDLQLVHTAEPFIKLINQGMILGEDGNKMSKSIGNVINPDEVIDVYGADSFRLYEMFMGPLTQEKPWSTQGLAGAHRFLNRTWRLMEKPLSDDSPPDALNKTLNKSIKKITHDTETLSFNTAIAQMMIMVNEMNTYDLRYKAVWEPFIIMLAPYVPHIAEELWEQLGNTTTITYATWPTYDENLTVDDVIEVVIQINGKVRARIDVERGTPQETLKTLAINNEKARQFIGDKTHKKIIVVADKLVNIVV